VADEPWVHLSSISGTTPAEVTVGLLDTGLAAGTHRATITVARPDVPGGQLLVGVEVAIGLGHTIYLPLVLR
jgi:hypothetical protein